MDGWGVGPNTGVKLTYLLAKTFFADCIYFTFFYLLYTIVKHDFETVFQGDL